jgi:Ni/Co efflux regulator RcnB
MTTRFECGYPDQRRDGYNDRDYREPKWHPGQVVPGQFLNWVVSDWEERGLSRPPSGHQWIRVGQQFLLVRASDRIIAGILNFD